MGSAVDFGGGFSSQKVSICTALHRWAVYNLGISRWRWHPPGGCHRGGLSLTETYQFYGFFGLFHKIRIS